MAVYAIGDVQGCFETLTHLLQSMGWDRTTDELWFVGDLVNRGPSSLEVLRFLNNTPNIKAVLGNHDIHLLRRYEGLAKEKPLDTLDEVLAAPDARELIDWLAQRPLLHHNRAWTMVHAGLLPEWTIDEASKVARKLESILSNPSRRREILENLPPELTALTTIRTCTSDGKLCDFKGPPDDCPPNCYPWFSHPGRKTKGQPIVFGHWATLGYVKGSDYLCVDSGCVWGRKLTGVRLDTGEVFQVTRQEAGLKD